MKPNTPTNQPVAKKPSTKPSITGGIFSFLALISSGIAHFLTHSEARSETEVTTAFGKVDSGPVAEIASDSVTGILSMPFIVGAVFFAGIAILFTLLRLRKVKATGMVFSILWIAICVWAVAIAFGAFDVIKADPVVN